MKISFPRMGTSYIAFKHLIEHLGHECIVPPAPSSKTLNLGVKHSPEFACIPFKVLTGTYLEALELGADTLITSGGVGPCRAGLYGMLHQKILQNLGYDFQMLVFEPPLLYLTDFISKLRKILKPNKISWHRFYKELKTAWQKLMILDDVEILSHRIRPYELIKGSTTSAFNNCLSLINEADSPEEIARSKESCADILNSIPQDKTRQPLRVGIIGEIYVVLEPFMNLEIEKILGELGVSTHRSIYLTQWARNNTIINTEGGIRKAAYPYLTRMIGGHGINSLGETVLYAKNRFDGVVQVAPFTCIPEIVAKSILPRVSKDLGIPVLSLTIDEQTGKAGVQTRLEAFVDLLRQKRLMEGSIYAGVPGN